MEPGLFIQVIDIFRSLVILFYTGKMNWDYTLYAAVLHITALISVGIALLLTRRRNAPGTDALILLMCAVAEWSFAAGMEAATVGIAQKILWSKIEYLGAVTAPTLFMIFTLEYRQMTRFLITALSAALFCHPTGSNHRNRDERLAWVDLE